MARFCENLLTPIRKESMKEKFEVVYDATFDCMCLLDDEIDEDALNIKLLTKFRRINKELKDIEELMSKSFNE